MSDTSDVITNSKQLAATSTWGKTPRQLANDFDPDKSSWGGAALHAAATELRQKLPSRANYRPNDKPVDTLAGMVLNDNAAIEDQRVETLATYGDAAALATIRAKADAGNARAQLFLKHLAATSVAPRAVAAPAVQRAAAGVTGSLPESVGDFLTPTRRGWLHTVIVTALAVVAVFFTNYDNALWGPLIAAAVLSVFDLAVSIAHVDRSQLPGRIRTGVYGIILAVQPIALVLHWGTDTQWTAVLQLVTAVFGGALAAAKTPKW